MLFCMLYVCVILTLSYEVWSLMDVYSLIWGSEFHQRSRSRPRFWVGLLTNLFLLPRTPVITGFGVCFIGGLSLEAWTDSLSNLLSVRSIGLPRRSPTLTFPPKLTGTPTRPDTFPVIKTSSPPANRRPEVSADSPPLLASFSQDGSFSPRVSSLPCGWGGGVFDDSHFFDVKGYGCLLPRELDSLYQSVVCGTDADRCWHINL